MLVVEQMPSLDIADLKELPAWPQFKMSGSATIQLREGDEVIDFSLTFLTDETPFGTRFWLACPTCGERRKHLHLAEGRLACRLCLGALYLRHSWPDSAWRREVGRPALIAWRSLQ